MSIPTITPPKVTEVLPDVKSKLTVSVLTTLLGGNYIYVAEGDSLDIPYTGKARIVLMWVKPQPHREHLDKSINVRFKVRCDFKPAKGDDPDIFIENLQGIIFELLQWQLLTLTKAKQIAPLLRLRAPVGTLYEKENSFFYNASEWSIFLTSTDN